MRLQGLMGVVLLMAVGQVSAASTFWNGIAKHDLDQYKGLSWRYNDDPDPCLLVETYIGENFWIHDYLKCASTPKWITHTGMDFNMGSSGDSNAIVASPGWGIIRKNGYETIPEGKKELNQVTIEHLLSNGETVTTNLLHMKHKDASHQGPHYTEEINNGDYVARRQWLGMEGKVGAPSFHLHFEYRKHDIPTNFETNNVTSSVAIPRPGQAANTDLALDGLTAHYASINPAVRFFRPTQVAETGDLLTFLTLYGDTIHPAVFGVAGQPLFGQLPIERKSSSKEFFTLGVMAKGGLDRANPVDLDTAGGKWLVKSWVDNGDWNDDTGRQITLTKTSASPAGSRAYPVGDYQFYPFVAYEHESSEDVALANRKAVLGYPVTLSVLPNKCSMVVDNDQANVGSRRFEPGFNAKTSDSIPGYYLTAYVERKRGQINWARWYPGAGQFRTEVFVPKGSSGTVRYKLVSNGLGEGTWHTLSLDGHEHAWVPLLADGDATPAFVEGGYIELSTDAASSPGLPSGARIPFDAIKFLAPTCTGASVTAVKGLNDTGITQCGDETQNGLSCPTLAQSQPWTAGQDGWYGRDRLAAQKLLPKTGGGQAGFDFTRISSTGASLPATATTWACVRDNVTGLMWENKTDDGGWRDKDRTYTWYEPDATRNGGNAGSKGSLGTCGLGLLTYCNTQAYVNKAKKVGLCGYKDWRLPSVEELGSIVHMGRTNPAIDNGYFPNTQSSYYWASSPVAAYGDNAWLVDFHLFYGGHGHWSYKYYANYVRLVRAGQ